MSQAPFRSRSKVALAATLAFSAFLPASAQVEPPLHPLAIAPNETAVVQEFLVDSSTRMTVPVRINGSQPYPFILDTGAERTVIASDLATLLALESGPLLTLATITGRSQVASYFIDQLDLKTINVQGLEAPALDRGNLGAYGLLGIDSLEDHRVLLDFRKKTMDVLVSEKTKKKTQLERGMIVVTARRQAGRMILSSAKIDGTRIDIILDTGAQSSMGNQALRKKLRRTQRSRDFIPMKMRSVTGGTLLGDFTQIRQIEVGGLMMRDLPITFADNYAFEALDLNDRPAILLGMDALRLFDRVMIDFVNRRVGFDLPPNVGHSSNRYLASLFFKPDTATP